MLSSRNIHFQIIKSQKSIDKNIVLVMGYSGSSGAWSDTFIHRLSENFNICIFDNLGTGNSPKPKEQDRYSISELSKDLESVIEACQFKSFYLLGYSLGGCISLEYAINTKNTKIEKLILLSTTTGGKGYFSPGEEILQRLENPSGSNLLEISQSIWEICMSKENVSKNFELLKSTMVYDKELLIPRFALKYQLWAYKNFNRDQKMSFRYPVIVVSGDSDPLTKVENSKYLAAKIQNSKLEIIPNCEHMPHIERPNQLIDLIINS